MYPVMSNIKKVCTVAGKNTYDPISGATIFDIIKWDKDTGKIWCSPVIASNLYDTREYYNDVQEIAFVGTGVITPDEIISRIAGNSCPHATDEYDTCPATSNGWPGCHLLPLCKYAQALKVEIEKGEAK